MITGIIIKATAGFYYVEIGDTVYECKARGAFRNEKISPLVGDRVDISLNGEKGVIEEIHPRKNSVVRPPVANIDRMFIVSSLGIPAPNTLLIDRSISICEKKGIEPIIVFNKNDCNSAEEYESVYKKAGFITAVTSCETKTGIEELKNLLVDGINVFMGNSGVGKSSLLNLIIPEQRLATAEISQKLGRGRHTTRTTELIKLGNKYIADTAGFSTFDIESYETVLKEDLPYTFREFKDFLGKCQFTSCSHTKEKGCAVIEAVNEGIIPKERHKNYCQIYDEIKNIKEWNKRVK